MTEFVVSNPIVRFLVRQPVGSEHEVDVVPGLRHDMVQSFDLIVSAGANADLYTVVNATMPMLSSHDREVIGQALASTRRPELCFLVESGQKSASVVGSGAADSSALAAATAVVRARAGWAEDAPMAIAVNGRERHVTPSFSDNNWRCRVE